MSDQTEAELEKTRKVVAEMSAEQAKAADGILPDAEPEAEEAEAEGWDAYTIAELQDVLRERDLPVSGSKAELVARLNEDDA